MHRPLYDQLVPYYELVEERDWGAEIRLISSLLKRNRSQIVIDLGCGPGYHVRSLAKLGFTTVGVDISPRNISFARKRARQEHVHARFVVGNYYHYRPAQTADAALCLNWSIPTRDDEIRRFLNNSRSILRTHGLLILDYERVADIVRKDLGKSVVSSWNVKGQIIVRVSVGNLLANVLHSRDVYILYPHYRPTESPDEVARYRALRGTSLAKIYTDASHVRFFSIPELRHFADKSGFRLVANYMLPRNRYKRNYAVLEKCF